MSWVQSQIMLSDFSLEVHDRPPSQVDLDALWREDHERFSRTTYVDGEHHYDSITHLVGYASNYYTYVLDKVIALDFFAQFDRSNLLNGPAAMRYRHTVLEPGSALPASQLVQNFLGRPQNMDALKRWVNEERTAPAK